MAVSRIPARLRGWLTQLRVQEVQEVPHDVTLAKKHVLPERSQVRHEPYMMSSRGLSTSPLNRVAGFILSRLVMAPALPSTCPVR